MLEYPVMKKAEEEPLIRGFKPVYMLVGVLLLMLSIVAMFAGGLSFLKFIIIVVFDLIAIIVMKFLSRDKVKKKQLNSFLFPIDLTIKGK